MMSYFDLSFEEGWNVGGRERSKKENGLLNGYRCRVVR